MAHGMAAIVLACGRKGERVVGPIAELSLTPIENAAGSLADLRLLRHQLASILGELCGQIPELVAQHLLVGRIFTPAEAVTYGLADRIEA
jgi:ATP-dependent Clp protease protease subunit